MLRMCTPPGSAAGQGKEESRAGRGLLSQKGGGKGLRPVVEVFAPRRGTGSSRMTEVPDPPRAFAAV